MGRSRRERQAEVLLAMHDVVARTDAAVAPLLVEHGLTPATAHLLWLVDPAAAPPSMKALAEQLGCAPSNVTFLSQHLETRGLAFRTPSTADRRQRVLGLTDAGVAARAAVVEQVARHSPLAALDDAALDAVLDALRAGRGAP